MPNDTTTATSTETGDETEPQAETATTTPTSETPESTTTEPSSSQISLEELQAQIKRLDAALKKANNDAKSHRLENADLKKFKEQTEAATLSEQQRQELAKQNLEKQLAETQAQLTEKERVAQERIVNLEVRLQAANMGVEPRHLDKMARLLDWAEIEYDDGGTPTNVKNLLDALHKDMPELFVKKAPPTSGGATNPPSSTASRQQLTWETIGKLTPSQYEARREEIQRWMNDPKNNHKRF